MLKTMAEPSRMVALEPERAPIGAQTGTTGP